MSRLPSTKSLPPARAQPPKRMNPMKSLRTSESCNFCHQHSAKSTDSSSQTIDVNDEYFLKDAIIRFPRASARRRGHEEVDELINDHGTQTDILQPIDLDSSQLSNKMLDLTISRPAHSAILPETVAEDQETKRKMTSTNKLEPKHRIGEVPKYLIQRKKDLAHAQSMANEAPAGHYLLTEEERQEALNLAQTRYDQLISQLNALSITSQTMRTRTIKIDIERELQSLENTLKIFSRNRVFVNFGE